MSEAKLNLEERKDIGGGKVNRLRKSGYIPAVIYGQGKEPTTVQVKTTDFRNFISKHGMNSVFSTEFAAEHDFSMVVKDIQYNEYGNDVVHLDFQRVSLTEPMHAEVPVRVIGAERVEKAGSVIVHQLNDVTVECLPQDVPQYVVADTTEMTTGSILMASQLKLPQGVKLITDPNDVILAVTGGKLDLDVQKVDEKVVPKGEEGNVNAKRV